MESEKPVLPAVVLWRINGMNKHIDAVLREASGGLEISVERGEEREVFLTYRAGSPTAVLSASQLLRTRLTENGWDLAHADGERQLATSLGENGHPFPR